MKMLVMFFIGVLASGCVPVSVVEPEVIVNKDIIQVGDSLCADSKYFKVAAQIVGFDRDCNPGRRLIDYDVLPNTKAVILSLITNDIINETPIDAYRLNLQQKLASTDAHVYCVLAVLNGRPEQDTYNNVMREECIDIIDPRECGIFPGQDDGIHWNSENNIKMAQCFREKIII